MAKQKRKPKTKAKPAKRAKPKTSKVKAKAKAKAKPAKAKTKAKPKAKAKSTAKAKPAAQNLKRERATTVPEDAVPEEVRAHGSGSNGSAPVNLQDEILAMARRLYGPNKTDAELLAFDPNDVDAMDPSIFYEMLQQRYGVQPDPDNDYFGGFGGPLAKLIAFMTQRWDGTTNNVTEEPPSDWLGDFVHD